jgi:hypothetical protein
MLPPHHLQQPLGDRRHQRSVQLGAATGRFRELLAKLGSGERTSTGLSQEEACEAIERILGGLASPEQVGAFLIAHRLRRPQPEEMAGMLQAYRQLGPTLPAVERREMSFGVPFDGRCRDAPLLPLTALVLVAAGLAVVLHGSEPMPVKYGATNAELMAAIDRDLGGMDAFKTAFAAAGAGQFGSGWAWLIVQDGRLKITATPNQDNPLMDVAEDRGAVVLAADVWEHAYYLNYQNRRADYLKAFWTVVNWNKANALFAAAMA